MLNRSQLAIVGAAAAALACSSTPDWARYPDGSPIRAAEEAEASLVLDSFNSNQSLLALIQLQREDTACAKCTLERHIEAEREALRHFLSKSQPPWAVERAQRRLDLLAQYREDHPFDPDECPPAPCLCSSELAAPQGAAGDEPQCVPLEP